MQKLPTGSRDWKKECDIRRALNESLDRRALYWKQRAKISWLNEGDKYSKFFFLLATIRGRRNAIGSILNREDTWITRQDLIGKEYTDFLTGIFSGNDAGRVMNCESLIHDRLSDLENEDLVRIPSFDEIRKTLFAMGSSKAPGPDGIKKGRGGFFAIKIDLVKAYDKLSWKFVNHVMSCFGALDKFCNWVSQCISTSTLNVYLNGGPVGKIVPSCGLHQGDPLSLYLFIWAVEILSRLLEDALGRGSIKGIKLNRGSGPILSHIFFTDDLILVGRATMVEAKGF
uniref:Reverse transcriptase domain-containing protein n=1 Tax=Cannabis sativa TaxID=3483 RepID=A0A803QBB4_CANSA